MRYLNKIIFINSSSIKYAEVALDGNVHFIGTQGVGKSTLLRTILFFYNTDKLKLGIGREKQRFDDYYFPYQNSYIIYEVQHDNRCYCVLAYKVSGKVAFRFIDSEYRRELFVNTKSWDDIRTALGSDVHYTRLVTRYEEFRDIIYGNNKGLDSKFKKYAIVEAKQYKNILLTIQNIFLNANLEAKFIKDTIIQSIDDKVAEIEIDNFINNHLNEFESNIKDIKLWFEKDKQGNIPIRKQADKVIDNHRQLNFLRREQQKIIQQLSCRIELIEKENPYLFNEYKIADEKLRNIIKTLENQKTIFQKRSQKLYSDINLVKNNLKIAKEKQQQYDNQNILQIVEQVAQEPRLSVEKNNLLEEKQVITSRFSDIEEKYKALMSQEHHQLQTFINEQEKEQTQHKSDWLDKKEQLSKETQQLIEQVRESYHNEFELLANRLTDIGKLISEQEKKLAELKHCPIYQTEIQQAEKTLADTKLQIATAKTEIKNAKAKRENVRKTGELEIQQLDRQHASNIEKIQQKISQTENIIEQEMAKLQHSEGSFYRWLNDNKPDWRDDIGKVIDEEIAFNEQLNPRVSSVATHSDLFGVEIDVEGLDNRIKTDEERQSYIANLQKELEQYHNRLSVQNTEHKQCIDNINKRFRKQINAINEDIAHNEYLHTTGEQNLKKHSVVLSEWQDKADKERQEQKQQCNYRLDELASQKQEVTDKKALQESKRQREINQLKNKETKSQQELKQQFDNAVLSIETLIKARKQANHDKIKTIQQQQYNELQQGGFESTRLETINNRLSVLEGLLNEINIQKIVVIEYQQNKREILDKVPTWKKEQQLLEKKYQQLEDEKQTKLEKLATQRNDQQGLTDSIKNKITEFEKDKEAFESFQKSEVFAELETYLITIGNKQIDNDERQNITAIALIEEVKDKSYKYQRIFSELKRMVNHFVGNFAENNLFKFATKFIDDDSIMTFATELKEFIEENKIAEFEKRVNGRFANIIREISRETDNLLTQENQIEKIIKNINKDFVSKNFVEAIKEMQMRKQESSNPVFQLLKQIKAFRDENDVILGERDLFTTDSTDEKNKEAITLLSQLLKKGKESKHDKLTLADSFDLQFRIVENDNDSGWVEKLSHVGSEGTDVLIKAIVNILLLNTFKDSESKKFKDFRLHCMMDEIGRLHPNNVKGILQFANDRNILLINGSPTSQDPMAYRYTYKLSKVQEKSGGKHVTQITRLVKVVD